MVPPPEVTWNKILTRISRIHGLSLDELSQRPHEDILEHYWRHIGQHHLDQLSIGHDGVKTKIAERQRRNVRFNKMRELDASGYFDLTVAKERDPGLYETVVGRDRVGRPDGQMKFSDVLMRCWMQERDPDTNRRKIDEDNGLVD